MKLSILTIILFLFSNRGEAQVRPYQIGFVGTQEEALHPALVGSSDSSSFVLLAQQRTNELISSGHLLANLDSIVCSVENCRAIIFVGEKYSWVEIRTLGFPEDLLAKAGYRSRDFYGQEININQYRRFVDKVLRLSADNGYPFAQILLDSPLVKKNGVSGVLTYQQGAEIKYDTLSVNKPFIKPAFLSAYLGIKKDALFNLADIKAIEKNISRLNYCQLEEPPQVSFSNNLAVTALNLKPVKANKIDAIIGFLPNQVDKDLLITGYVDLDLQNLFKSGKRLAFLWRQFDQQSQVLDISYQHPNLFRSPVGLGLGFDLLKQDTTYLSRNFTVTTDLNTRTLEILFKADFKASRMLGTIPVGAAELLISDFDLQYYGFSLAKNMLDDPVNPLKGYRWTSGGDIGNKKIIPNALVPGEAYDTLDAKSTQLKLDVGGEINQPLGSVFVGHIDMSGGIILNDDALFLNDMYRLGGLQSLRGFNDLELFVSGYLLGRIEARLLMGERSRLFLFYDQAYTFNEITQATDTPLGFGAGMLLSIGEGTLQLAYALGKSSQQSLSLTQSKIHLGYVAKF